MLLARMVYYYIPSHSLFRIQASTFALTFVSLDFVSFVIQLVGGSMAPPGAPHDEVMRGIHVYMGGIGMQEAFIVFFVVLVVRSCPPLPSHFSSYDIYRRADVRSVW